MLLIGRYISGSVLTATLYAVLVLSVVLVFGNVFKEALDLLINRNVPAGYLLFFMACVLPFSLTFTVPWGFLTATLLILGRMSADHETVALRASGVSLFRAFLPVLVIGMGLSVFCIWLNTTVKPRAELAMRQSLVDMARSNPDSLFVAGEVIDEFEGKKIFVRSKNIDWLEGVTVFEENTDGLPTSIIQATHGKIGISEDKQSLSLLLWNARLELRDNESPRDLAKIRYGTFVRELTAPISLEALSRKPAIRPLGTYTLKELLRLLLPAPADEPSASRTSILTEINNRLSLGFASLAFAIVAIPLGIVAQRRETSAGFAMSLLVAFSYFAFVELARIFRNNSDAYPYLILWVPNVLALLIGGLLLWRLDRR